MNWTILKNKKEYNNAVARLDKIFDAKPNSKNFEEAELLGLLIENYEEKHYPILPPEPLEAVKLKMQENGLRNKDLENYIGSKSYISSILNGKKEITLRVASIFHQHLGIPAEIFMQKS